MNSKICNGLPHLGIECGKEFFQTENQSNGTFARVIYCQSCRDIYRKKRNNKAGEGHKEKWNRLKYANVKKWQELSPMDIFISPRLAR